MATQARERERDDRTAFLLLGVGAGALLLSPEVRTRLQTFLDWVFLPGPGAPGEDGELPGIPGGVPDDGLLSLYVTGRLGPRQALTTLDTGLVLRNGTDEDIDVALTLDASNTSIRGGAWTSVAATVPIHSEAHTEDRVSVPGWSVEQGSRYRGTWNVRARAWVDGVVVAEVIVQNYVRIA